MGFPQGQIAMVPPRTRIRVTGGSFPAAIWKAFMLAATRGMPVRKFEKPVSQFVTVSVDIQKGCVATAETPRYRIREVQFVRGTQPTKECTYKGMPGNGTGPVVPSVVGLPVAEAERRLADVGLSVEREYQYYTVFPPGTVVRQEPSPGSPVPVDDTVTLIVSTDERPRTEVPSVIGLSQPDAVRRLKDAGFVTQVKTAESHDPGFPPGVVIVQSPNPGVKKPEGTLVTIWMNPEPGPSPSPSPSG